MSERSFTYGGATVTVRDGIGWDGLDQQFVINKLRPALDMSDEVVWNRVLQFTNAVVRTLRVEGSLGFDWVTPKSSEAALLAAYNAWCTTDGGALALTWIGELVRVEIDMPGDPDLYPGVDEKKDATLPSNENDLSSEPALTPTSPELSPLVTSSSS